MSDLIAEVRGERMLFKLAADGWYEYRREDKASGCEYAISPDLKRCVVDPWYGGVITGASAPQEEFKIIGGEK